jgi:hypothetical protein
MSRVNIDYLLGQSYHPKVTRMDRPALGSRAVATASTGAPRTGPLRSNDIPFTLIANATSFNVSTSNPYRESLILQNKDPVANLFFRFGGPADASSAFLLPNQFMLLDVKCPTDPVFVFATANISGTFIEMARIAE